MQVNCATITVSVSFAESPELVLVLAGERHVLPLHKHKRIFEEVCNLVVDASESWSDGE